MRPSDPIVVAALASQERERASGFAESNPSLASLRELRSDELVHLVHELRSGGAAERELAARLLAHSSLSEETTVKVVRDLLNGESNPDVIRWLVAALPHAGTPLALPDLEALSRHQDARVRFGVPDALSSCAKDAEVVAEALLRLSRDSDRDVRWSAAFELAAWLNETSAATTRDSFLRRLHEIETSDPDSEIRSVAARAIASDTP